MTDTPIENRWDAYYRAVAGRTPRPLLLNALAYVAADGGPPPDALAVDYGCGDGTETYALLARGWRVLAIDQEPAAISRVLNAAPPEARSRLQTQLVAFADMALPPANLIYAGLSLPFCAPAHFPAVWRTIVASLRGGGRFAGHFFGPRDGWRERADMTFHSSEDVRALLSGFVIESLAETEEQRATALGEPKHWHIIEVIARSR
jgi:SAM-dependent methyltransferase